MESNFGARNTILGAIRSALGETQSADRIAAEYAALPRGYKRQGTLSEEERLWLFQHRLEEYGAGVRRVAGDGAGDRIKDQIAVRLTARGCKRLVIPYGLPAAWLPAGFHFQPYGGSGASGVPLEPDALDRMDGVLTGCTVAIAETGSIILQSGEQQGVRALTLVPDYHLCVVFAEQVVETVPESFARLDATSNLPTTFFSGPSATADIEMTRIKGVHGPRFLDVLLVG
ncbi:MAG: LutC/YkgG family protein [Acidobacteriaceae bacterium]